MTLKFYAALPVRSESPELNGGHITTMFSPLTGTGRWHTGEAERSGIVTAVEYWQGRNLTVAIVKCKYAEQRHSYWFEQGFRYDYAYRPHVSIGAGDSTRELRHLVGARFVTEREFARLFTR